MSGKITATFGADVSEVEAKMMQATRATKAYERAVNALDGKKSGGDMTANLARQNEQIAKAMNILKGGAVGTGVAMLISQMKGFASAAEQMGDKASVAQKSAAQWGKEWDSFSSIFTQAGASVLGTLAGWGRSIGDVFRSPLEKSYDGVAESSERAAERQEAALKKSKEAHKKAAEEIPALLEKLKGEQRETELSSLSEYGRILTERAELEKKMEENKVKPKNDITKAEAIKLATEMETLSRNQASVEKKLREEEAAEAKKAADEKKQTAEKVSAALQKSADEEAVKQKKAAEELANLKYQKAWDGATNEQRLIQAIKEGRKALAAYEQNKTDENLLAVEKVRKKYEDVKEAIKAAADETKGISPGSDEKLKGSGLQRGEDGKLRRGKIIVSDADAARALKLKESDAGFNAKVNAQKIKDAGTGSGGLKGALSETEKLLGEIKTNLTPTKL